LVDQTGVEPVTS